MANPNTTPALPLVAKNVEAVAAQWPHSAALQWGDHVLNYEELWRLSGWWQERLFGQDATPQVIGLGAQKSKNKLLALLAIWRSGNTCLPLDTRLPAARLQLMVQQAQPSFVLVDDPAEAAVFSALQQPVIVLEEEERFLQKQDMSPPLRENPHALAYVLFTSGSTGIPKGVEMGGQAFASLVDWQVKNSTALPGSRSLHFSPLVFDVGFQEIAATWSAGACLVVPDEDTRMDPFLLMDFLAQQKINRLFLPFVALQQLCDAVVNSGLHLPALQEVITAGEALKATPVLRQFFSLHPQAQLVNQYGPTETHVVSAYALPPGPHAWPNLPPIGQPLPGTCFALQNEAGEWVEDEGTLWVSGPGLANGYLADPIKTLDKFQEKDHPTWGKRRWYNTGDQVRLSADGQYHFLGRKDQQVKLRGYRIETAEIEKALLDHPGMQQAVVRLHPAAGVLVAYVVFSGERMPEKTLRAQLLSVLPDYMVPSYFVPLRKMPLTPSGKTDLQALDQWDLPSASKQEAKTKQDTPGLEACLQALWQSFFPQQNWTPQDSFFHLGGNSLQAVQAVRRIREATGWAIGIAAFYRLASIENLVKAHLGIPAQQVLPQPISTTNAATDKDIAVIGLSGQFPGAENIAAFWELLQQGKTGIRFFADHEIDASVPLAERQSAQYVKARGILPRAGWFDAAFFGLTPLQADCMDPQQRLFLMEAWKLLESSGYLVEREHKSIGVFAGTGNNSYWEKNVRSHPEHLEQVGGFTAMTLNEKDYVANRVAHVLDLKGPAVAVYAACATSALAIAQAVMAIRAGQCEMALAGGSSVHSPLFSGHLFQEDSIYSKDGHCRPFDQQASGTVFSDGVGLVLLKSKAAALADGDPIYAVIKGIGVNNDGAQKASFSAPSAVGQATVIQQATADAGIQTADLAYIEAHGTATPIGDPIEWEGLHLALGARQPQSRIAVGSVKSNIGHLTAAAGVAGFIKTVLMLHHRKWVPTVHFQQPLAALEYDTSAFYVAHQTADWPEAASAFVGLSSFGVGGTNVHLVLGPGQMPEAPVAVAEGPFLVIWSAQSAAGLKAYAEALFQYVSARPELSLFQLSYTLQCRRIHFAHRAALWVTDAAALLQALKEFLAAVEMPLPQGHPLLDLGRQWRGGTAVDFGAYHGQNKPLPLYDLPTYAFDLKEHWLSLLVPVTTSAATTTTPTAENSNTRDALLDIIVAVSGEERDDLEPDTPFVALGLDSLVLTQMALQVNKKFKVNLPFRLLNEGQDTVHKLVQWLEAQQPAPVTNNPVPVTVVQTEEALPTDANKPFGAIAKIDKQWGQLGEQQMAFLQNLVKEYNAKTASSKQFAQDNRLVMADPRVVTGFKPMWKELVYPLVVNRSAGAYIWDLDGNVYLDALNGFGSNILGYQHPAVQTAVQEQLSQGYEIGPQHPLAAKVCQQIARLTGMERVALCNTGSEAVLGALRMARTVTGRSLVVAFNGSYHGINDEVIVRGNAKGKPFPAAPGILPAAVENMLVLDYGTPESLAIIASRASDIAAVLVEPVQSRRPEWQPVGFLHELRTLTQEKGIALVLDEVITGFRAAPGGVQELFGIRADLVTYGKVVGGGMPIGVMAGSAQWMDALDGGQWQFGDLSVPEKGVTYFAGTFVRHPLALAAAHASLTLFEQQKETFTQRLNALTQNMCAQLNAISEAAQMPYVAVHFGSLWKIKTKNDWPNAEILFVLMRQKGIHIWDGFPCFLTDAYTQKEVDQLVQAFQSCIADLTAANWFQAAAGLPTLNMTDAQKEIWLGCQVGGDAASLAFNESVRLRLEGAIDAQALSTAFDQLVQRHPILTAHVLKDLPVLAFHPPVVCTLAIEDHRGLTPAAQKQVLQAQEASDMNTVFDLEQGPLLKVRLTQWSETSADLVVVGHHLLLDGWSMGMLLQEWGKCYSAILQGQSANLVQPHDFATYAQALQADKNSGALEAREAFWVNALKKLDEPFQLPLLGNRPPQRTYTADRWDRTLPAAGMEKLRRAAAEKGHGLVLAFLALTETFLQRITGAEKVLLGLPMAGQAQWADAPLMGHCVHLLPLLSEHQPKESFWAYLAKRKASWLEQEAHGKISYGRLVEKLPHLRTLQGAPLLPFVLNLDMGLDDGVKFGDCNHQLFTQKRTHEIFDVFLNITGTKGKYTMEWSYNKDLFSEPVIAAWSAAFLHWMDQVLANPDLPLEQLNLCSPQNRTHLLPLMQGPALPTKAYASVVDLFDQRTKENPGATALVFEGQQYSYTQLQERSCVLAHQLQAAGAGKGKKVAVCFERSFEMVAAVLAVYRSGAAFLALDAQHPVARNQQYLRLAKADFLFTTVDLAVNLPTGAAGVETSLLVPTNEQPDVVLSPTDFAPLLPTDVSFVLFTSGSTGTPKAAELTHGGLAHIILGLQSLLSFSPKDSLLMVTTIIFDLAQADIFLPLVSGAKLVLTNAFEARDGWSLLQLLSQENITYIESPPATYKIMLEAGWTYRENLRVTVCGEPLQPAFADLLLTKTDQLYNMYGPTETTIYATAAVISRQQNPVPIGKPFPGVQLAVRDVAGHFLPPYFMGELLIGGPGVGNGYLNDAQKTASQFFHPDWAPGQKHYATGDYGYVDESGNWYCLGRKDQQVKLRGQRIELDEAAAVIRQIPGVQDALVRCVKEQATQEQFLIGYYVAPTEWPIGFLREHFLSKLPAHFCPNFWVHLSHFPLTGSGKIDRAALPLPDLRPVPKDTAPTLSATETALLKIWKSVMPSLDIDVESHFFEAGGHSLMAIQIMNTIHREMGRKLPISILFQYPKLSNLAAYLDHAVQPAASPCLVPIKSSGQKPPVFLIHGDGLNVLAFQHLLPLMPADQPLYGLQVKGLDGQSLPPDSIPAIAAEYIADIRTVQPHGPYYLGGYSFGGLVAYEMAKQLKAEGESIGLLAMLDTNISNEDFYCPQQNSKWGKVKRQFPKLLFNLKNLWHHPAATLAYQRFIFSARWQQWKNKNKAVVSSDKPHEDLILERISLAYRQYQVAPMDQDLVVFRCMERFYYINDPEHLGWKKFVVGKITVLDVPGDHSTFLLPPNVQTFAQALLPLLSPPVDP